MTRFTLPIWIGAAGVIALAFGVTIPRALRAHARAAEAMTSVQEAARHAETIASTRARDGVVASATDNARGGLAARVAAVLQHAGLPASAMSALSPEAESPAAHLSGVRVVRRKATLTLAGVTLPQVGTFLDVWRASEPAWVPASIDLSPASGRAPEAGGDVPLRVVVVIESVVTTHEEQRP